MEETERESRPSSPDIPKLPIKTYRWEDVRRSRKRGAYPWTHLTKPPYDEEVDPEDFTMDAFRRSRSTSTLGKSETHEISDIEEVNVVSDQESKENIEPSVSAKHLDIIPINDSKDRAKSEEPTKKRRLSVDSSYSRISLPKLRIMERLKNAKGRITIPKRTRSNVSDSKKVKKTKVAPASTAKKNKLQEPVNKSPVYIHIPLKPPPGQTDEFSKYEFESPSHTPPGSLKNLNEIPEKKRKTSLLGILTQIKLAHDEHVARSSPSAESKKIKLKPDGDADEIVMHSEEEATTEEELTITPNEEPTVEIEESGSTSQADLQQSLTIEEMGEEEVIKIVDHETIDIENSSVEDNISQCLDKDEPCAVIQKTATSQTSTFQPDPEKLRKLEGALSKWKRQVPKPPNLELPPREVMPTRAKSEEPKRKRRSSIDSSYSRKSLSKLAFLKKIKQAKSKIKMPKFPSFSKFDKKDSSKVKEKKESSQGPAALAKKTVNPEKPVYIHIPLKPPPGQTDEFSHLENEPVEVTVTESKTENDDKEVDTTEASPEGSNVQLIILTPPSDDEILDTAGSETPSECDQKFFENLKIEDLKTLAKNAVNTVYPEVKTLETVVEDDNSETDAISQTNEEPVVPKHQILVDEEDGLKLSEAAIAMINEELEKEYRQQAMGLKSIIKTETSPTLKKKVSFKRKSRQKGGDGIYEDVQFRKGVGKTAPDDEAVVAHSVVIPLDSFQSMSVDEEKSYLDKELIKTTSLEDDYNKWSKLNDHEYEPVNPPPEVITIKHPSVIHDNAQEKHQTSPEKERLKRKGEEQTNAMHEVQEEIENRFFQSAEPSKAPDHGSSTLPKPDVTASKEPAKKSSSKNLNETIKTQANKLKFKIQNIKRPNISLPQRPHITLPQRPKFPTTKLRKPNFKKPNIKLPKLPDRPNINLPSFNFSRKSTKDSWRERQLSTESNAGDSKKKIFDFRTYPRMFDRSKTKQKDETSTLPPEFATMPRTGKNKSARIEESPKIIRIPLHPQEDEPVDVPQDIEMEDESETDYKPDTEDSLFSQDFLKRWEHGKFHEEVRVPSEQHHENYVDDEDRTHEDPHIHGNDSFEITPPKDHSPDSFSEHRRGVLEEIDSDEFFLREKGISQEDIEVGKYLSSEIREAFRNPMAKFHSEDREYDMELSDQSEPVQTPRRKPLRKPKRKKTPHVSREQISFDRESYNTEPEESLKTFGEVIEITPPVRPTRRSSRKKKKFPIGDVIPYQETIPIDDQADVFDRGSYTVDILEDSEILPNNILSDDIQYRYESDFSKMYENEHMKGIEQPEITVSHTYYRFELYPDNEPPIPPARRQRSFRSLTPSDQGSALEEDKVSINDASDEHIPQYFGEQEYIIPTPEPPIRPRRTRSRTRSESVSQQQEEDDIPQLPPEEERSFDVEVVPVPMDEVQIEVVEIIEAPCIKDIRDASGYAIIDKTKVRDPPLPPSRFDRMPKTPPRRRRNKKTTSDDKFATVPRLSSDSDPPRRPLRNYSTLRGTTNSLTEEEKENLNLSAGHLQSGEVIQKMRDRPLPAPPRPPRKVRPALSDISLSQNIMMDSEEDLSKLDADVLLDIESQIEEFDHEETVTHGSLILQTTVDPNIVPYAEVSKSTRSNGKTSTEHIIPITQELDDQLQDQPAYEDDVFSTGPNVKTSTEHISTMQEVDDKLELELQDQPADEDDDFSVVPTEFANLKSPELILRGQVEEITKEKPEEFIEDSVVPQDFHELNDNITDEKLIKTELPAPSQNSPLDSQMVNVLRAQKLQVCDLDVDKLRVRELQASKIVVSELDGISLQVSEINSKCGNLVVSGIDLPPNLIQEMLQQLQLAASAQLSPSEPPASETSKQKTSAEEMEEEGPPVPPRYDSRTNLLDEENPPGSSNLESETLQPPVRPPRRSSQVEKLIGDVETVQDPSSTKEPDASTVYPEREITPEIVQLESNEAELPPPELVMEGKTLSKSSPNSDDEPPPRPPEPLMNDELDYVSSQPPPSFLALKSPHLKEFFDEDIPSAPRRKRHHRPPPVSRSSSDDVAPARRRHHRSPEPSIPQLTGQLVRLCATESERSIKRLISHFTNTVLLNVDGKQDLHDKRKVPEPIQLLLEQDKFYTQKLVLWSNQFLPLRSLRIHYKALEISCHGIPWFACWMAFMWIYTNESLVQMQINMLIGLIFDVVFVAVLKAYVRRRRPHANTDDMLGQLGPDKFSFPSGHASRAVFVAYFFICLYPLSIFTFPPLLAWATSVCISRILLNRHHILDVVCGVLLGIFNGWLLSMLWLSQESSAWLWSSLSDETLQGAEYHV